MDCLDLGHGCRGLGARAGRLWVGTWEGWAREKGGGGAGRAERMGQGAGVRDPGALQKGTVECGGGGAVAGRQAG